MTFAAPLLYRVRDVQKKRVVVRSLAEVDRYFEHVDECFHRSNDEGTAALNALRMLPRARKHLDPFSLDYQRAQWDLYLEISERSRYDAAACETTTFDVDRNVIKPYPLTTGSASLWGEQLLGQGFLLQTLGRLPGRRLAEIGPGWGHVTLAAAQLGYDVTAVEIDPRFGELLTKRAALLQVPLQVERTDMIQFETKDPFDVVLFYESFHHCHDHQEMVRQLQHLVRPGGAVVFASEPITIFPEPWGLRLDGQSLWAVRKYGWLELGFDRVYFRELMRRAGWRLEYRKSSVSHITRLWIAQRA